MEAYNTRRRRDLKDLGAVIAHAFHEPAKLEELLPEKKPQAELVSAGEKWW